MNYYRFGMGGNLNFLSLIFLQVSLWIGCLALAKLNNIVSAKSDALNVHEIAIDRVYLRTADKRILQFNVMSYFTILDLIHYKLGDFWYTYIYDIIVVKLHIFM